MDEVGADLPQATSATVLYDRRADFFLLQLEGVLTRSVEGTEERFQTGQGWVEPGRVHGAGNTTDASARVLVTAVIPRACRSRPLPRPEPPSRFARSTHGGDVPPPARNTSERAIRPAPLHSGLRGGSHFTCPYARRADVRDGALRRHATAGRGRRGVVLSWRDVDQPAGVPWRLAELVHCKTEGNQLFVPSRGGNAIADLSVRRDQVATDPGARPAIHRGSRFAPTCASGPSPWSRRFNRLMASVQ